ncbi:hypothetical protein [Nonomuraea sp. NPDC049309]|uniref:hypothetical protein n=1 Tax=Nonomuraea sp. NPDC049309 TaxID=3364350 RepID=UPI0037105225
MSLSPTFMASVDSEDVVQHLNLALTVLEVPVAVVFLYMGLSAKRSDRFLLWISEHMRVPAVFWGLFGLITLVATSTVTAQQVQELLLEHSKPDVNATPSWWRIPLLIFLIGAILASCKILMNARRLYLAGMAPRRDRLRMLNPLSTFRTAEKISSPSVRFLVFILSAIIAGRFWLGSLGLYHMPQPIGGEALPHLLLMTLIGLWLCDYSRKSKSVKSPASTFIGIGLRCIGTAGCILALSLWASCFLLLFVKELAPGWWIYRIYAPLGLFLAGQVYHAGQDVLRFSRRHLTKIIRDTDQLNGESFVLYLRPFASDALQNSPQRVPWRGLMPLARLLVTGRTEEERIAAALKRRVSPLVAVGQPGETLPYVGATRLYLPLNDWQAPVRELMRRARMVVLSLGPGEGTMWELREAFRTLPPERLILLVPMDREEYMTFRSCVHANLAEHNVRVHPRSGGSPMVPQLPESTSQGNAPSIIRGAICFTPEWNAEYLNLEEHARTLTFIIDWLPQALRVALRPAVRRLAAYEFDTAK